MHKTYAMEALDYRLASKVKQLLGTRGKNIITSLEMYSYVSMEGNISVTILFTFKSYANIGWTVSCIFS
jgi:hypothetical protein